MRREKAGPYLNHTVLIPKVRRPLQPHTCRKAPWRPKGSDANWGCTHTALWWNTSWLRDACAHMEGSWDIPNMDCEPGKSKWLAKGNPEEMPRKSNSNCREVSVTLSPLLSIHTCTLFHPHKYLFHYFPPLCEFFAKPKGQGPCHWQLVQWPGSGLSPKSWLKTLQAEATQDHPGCDLC